MIVRISTEGQYELSDADGEALNELDNEIVLACESGDATAFHATFSQMLELVRTRGRSLGEDDLSGSDIILPPADVSFDEARQEFRGEGLIPG
ncbi:MAG: PspA-associated protein PspAA [Solirubrobacteraceae bacterium]